MTRQPRIAGQGVYPMTMILTPVRIRMMAIRLRQSAVVPTRFGRVTGVLLVIGLLVAASSIYFAGDWRNVDVDFYHLYALGFWGNPSHRLLPTEYPPLSILPFSLTLLGPVEWFPVTFALSMAAIAVLGFLAFFRFTSTRQAGAYAIYALAAGIATTFYRYDLVPALAAAAAVVLLYRRRFTLSYALLAFATLLKLFPVVLIPIAVLAQRYSVPRERRSNWMAPSVGVALCVSVIVVGFLVAAMIDRAHAFGSLTYDLQRPDEVESVPATMLWLTSLAGVASHPDASFGALNLVGPAAPVINVLADCALFGGLALVYSQLARRHLTLGQAAVGAVLVLLCTSKVLSAQYFIWLAPLLALTVGFELRWLALFLLTDLIFPTLWAHAIVHTSVPRYTAVLLVSIAARNGVLVWLTIDFLRHPGVDLEAKRVASRGRGVDTVQYREDPSPDLPTAGSRDCVVDANS